MSQIPDNAISSVFVGNSNIEIITVRHPQNNLSGYHRISKTHYVDSSTGELKEYGINSHDEDIVAWLRRSMTKLRRMIDCNFICDKSELFITLTFETRVTYYEARAAFYKFRRSFLYHYKDCSYIMIIEPNENGNWHLHVLVKCFSGSLTIGHSELSSLWRHGYVFVKRIPFQNFGKYFAKREKMMRANFYPPHVKLFTASKGLNRPVAKKMTHAEALFLVHDHQLLFEFETPILSENQIVNNVNYQIFRRNNNEQL